MAVAHGRASNAHLDDTSEVNAIQKVTETVMNRGSRKNLCHLQVSKKGKIGMGTATFATLVVINRRVVAAARVAAAAVRDIEVGTL